MSEDLLGLDFTEAELTPPAGDPARFGGRWRLVGAGLSDVWKYGDLELPANSGRLLMRGPNGTGKTTALEALWPYVLDLNAARLGAGKARFTTLKGLMDEGPDSKRRRRYGYVWLTFAAPQPVAAHDDVEPELVSYGVRLQYSTGGSPPVKAIGFTVPGRPLKTVPLRGEQRSALELEQFTELISAAGGRVFTDDDNGYVDDFARRVWGCTAADLRELAAKLREVRNPSLLGDVTPRGAADALRDSLPGVDTDVLTATAEALDASNTTREAFARDSQAATVLADFAQFWAGHATDVMRSAHQSAVDAATIAGQYVREQGRLRTLLDQHVGAETKAAAHVQWLTQQIQRAAADRGALEKSDDYKASGRLGDLERTGRAERGKADSDFGQLSSAAEQAAQRTRRHHRSLDGLVQDLAAAAAAATAQGADPVTPGSLLALTTRPRSMYLVGERSADPGAGLTVSADSDAVATVASQWRELAERSRARADAAGLALTDHRTVEAAAAAAQTRAADATRAAEAFDRHEAVLRRSTQAATKAQAQLLDALASWAPAHPGLRGITAPPASDVRPAADADTDQTDAKAKTTGEDGTWDLSDVHVLRDHEPATVLAMVADWSRLALQSAERQAANDTQAATNLESAASQGRTDAQALRTQAERLRSGQLLLLLPRPHWVTTGDDDSQAFGSALEWTDSIPAGTGRDLLEAALADSGVLAAKLNPSGAHTSAWQINTAGPAVPDNLTAVLRSDPDHPHAEQIHAVLSRIALARHARPAAEGPPDSGQAGLVVGRDGTWRAGVLLADSARAAEQRGQAIATATHIGARQRRDAALRRAAQLDEQADSLEQSAAADVAAALTLRARVRQVRADAKTFPRTEPLGDAESARVADARQAGTLEEARSSTAAASAAATLAHTSELEGWTARTTGRDLPTDLERLRELVRTGKGRYTRLTELAGTLQGTLLPRLRESLDDLDDEGAVTASLSRLASVATSSDITASKTEREVAQLRAQSGQSMQVALREHARLTEELEEAQEELPQAQLAQAAASGHVVETRTLLGAAETNVLGAQPTLLASVTRLRRLLAVPAVIEVLLTSATLDEDDDAMLEQLDALLAGRRTTPRHLVGQRYDTARAELARTWTLARADAGHGLGELDLYVLTHDEHEYTPIAAAAKADQLARRASEQLAAAEQSALTDFVIGQLPAAIGTAWVALRDWRQDVNRKMRSTAASSGVGVQVETPLRDDLDDATKTVYRLCCQTSNADRTAQDKVDVGQALQSLLAAAAGDTMLERLSKAVNISDWVDVHYLVTRPGSTATRWNQRTGLSGGERRLVVLAPMLAAVAATYDRLGPTGLRLAALDEVPAEVDERGREGLARYIAELDLDLLCTSYLWDGAPGAWDGIDAHDLEVAPDGTVVAYPMLVRGLLALHGDAAQGPQL